jgi:hypothetical protein
MQNWKDLGGTPFLLFIYYLLVGKIEIGSQEAKSQYLVRIGHRITKLDSQLGAADRAED